MKIKPSTPVREIDCKRLRIPFILTETCPKCEAEIEQDFSDDHYLSNPVPNEVFKHGLWCPECDHEWEVALVLNISLESAEVK